MQNNSRTRLVNILTFVILIATVCLASFYLLIGTNTYNPFPPPTAVAVASLPTLTPTPSGPTAIPTWTPTAPPTEGAATETPTPTLTPSATPTFPPSPTFPPTATPTPRVTRSPLPFTYELDLRSPQYGCSWTGVAGEVKDLDDNPLVGFPVHVWGAGIDVVVTSGVDARFNTIYGNGAAWEQFFDGKPKEMEIRVQLHDPYRDDHPPVSEEIVINMPGYCGGALAYITFTQNH